MRPIIKTDADIIGGWGFVPALDGDLATVIPDPADPTAPTATTDQQTQTAATTAIVQQTLLPPPPLPNACITADGHSFSQAFYIWLLKLQQRVGGFSASPTDDAAVLAYDPYPRSIEPSHDLSFDVSPRPAPFMEWQVDPSPRPTNPEDLWPAPDVRQWVLAQHYLTSVVGYVPTTRTISTTAPLTGGGDLSANRTFAIPAATASVDGYATSTQITKLDGIAAGAQVNVLESVSGTAPVVVGAVTAKSQAISMAAATTLVPGYLTAADWNTFNGKLTSALTSGFIFVGNASNVATGVAVTGDAAMSNAGILGVNKTRLNVRNETGVTIASTRAVYVNGFNNLPLILLADNTDEAKHNVIGITIAPIAHQADGFIATSGQCDAETNAWAVGTELYVSTAGALTSTEPTSGEVRHAGIVTVRANYPAGKLLVYGGLESAVRGVGVGSGIIDRLGDSIGATAWSLHNYADAEVAKITSLGALTALTVAKTGGTAAQFLKADGTVDSALYTALPTTTAVVSATLTAGQWVNFHNVAGVKNARPADSTDATKPAQGFVLAGFASAATATVYLYGVNTVIPVGAYAAADVGKPVFLSTAGGTTLTPPTTTGNLLQQVGWVDAVGTTVIVNFTNSPGIVRA